MPKLNAIVNFKFNYVKLLEYTSIIVLNTAVDSVMRVTNQDYKRKRKTDKTCTL